MSALFRGRFTAQVDGLPLVSEDPTVAGGVTGSPPD